MEDAYDHAHRSLLYSRLGQAAKAEAEWQAAIKILPSDPMIWLSRAYQFVEQERKKEAEDVLGKIEASPSADANVWKECGRLRFALGQKERATADLQKAVDLLGDKAMPIEAATSGAEKLFSQLADKALLQRLTTAVERNPEDPVKRRDRGEWYARHRRWKEAAADFRMVLQRDPPNESWPWLHVAPVLVAAGDRASYLQLCRAMRKQFNNPQDPITAERLAKAHLILADADTLEWAGQMADRSVALGKKHNYEVYFLFCKALADYRRGDYRAVLETHTALMPPRNERLDVIVGYHPIRAMALHRLGDAQAAREELAHAAKLLDQNLPDPDRFLTQGDAGYDHDWLIAWLLYSEAKALIEGNKAEAKR